MVKHIINMDNLDLLRRFYDDVYTPNFPDENERETFDNLVYYVDAGIRNQEYDYYITVFTDESDNVIGGAIFNYFVPIRSGFLEFQAINKNCQSSGLGSIIYADVVDTLITGAANYYTEDGLLYIFGEIDNPEIKKSPDELKYLYFWNKQGYKKLEYTYIQPPLEEGKQPVTHLFNLCKSMKGMKYLDASIVQNMLYYFLKYCLQIENPYENEYYISMYNELESIQIVECTDLMSTDQAKSKSFSALKAASGK